jgi:hypothetical protein
MSFRQSALAEERSDELQTSLTPRTRGWHGRMSALLLIISLLLPFAQFAFASPENLDVFLPVCCRAHGKHKCLMRMGMRIDGQSEQSPPSPQLAQVTEKCPYVPGAAPSAHGNPLWDDPQVVTRFNSDSCDAPIRLVNVERPYSAGRANPKRGPPVSREIA